MKKLVLLTIMLLIALFVAAVPAMAEENKPAEISQSTLVPLSPIFLNLGIKINWEPANQEITLSRDGKEAVIKMYSREAIIQGVTKNLCNTIELINGRVYGPVELIGAFGDKVTLRGNLIVVTMAY